MKKLLIAALMVVTMGTAAIAAPFMPVTTKMLSHFNENYSNAINVKWTTGETFVKATFTQNNKKWEVFYDAEGNLYGTSRVIPFSELPAKAAAYINKKYADYTIHETIEFDSAEEGIHYYVSVKQKHKRYILRAEQSGWVSVFKFNRVK